MGDGLAEAGEMDGMGAFCKHLDECSFEEVDIAEEVAEEEWEED